MTQKPLKSTRTLQVIGVNEEKLKASQDLKKRRQSRSGRNELKTAEI